MSSQLAVWCEQKSLNNYENVCKAHESWCNYGAAVGLRPRCGLQAAGRRGVLQGFTAEHWSTARAVYSIQLPTKHSEKFSRWPRLNFI